MANKINVKLILELRKANMSRNEIAATRHMSKNSVSEVIHLSDDLGITYDDVADIDADNVYRMFYPDKYATELLYTDPDYEYLHKELTRVGVNLKLLWKEYKNKCASAHTLPMGYTKFCSGYSDFTVENKLTNHLEHRPGVITEVDWSGPTMSYVDTSTGEVVTVYLFVGSLNTTNANISASNTQLTNANAELTKINANLTATNQNLTNTNAGLMSTNAGLTTNNKTLSDLANNSTSTLITKANDNNSPLSGKAFVIVPNADGTSSLVDSSALPNGVTVKPQETTGTSEGETSSQTETKEEESTTSLDDVFKETEDSKESLTESLTKETESIVSVTTAQELMTEQLPGPIEENSNKSWMIVVAILAVAGVIAFGVACITVLKKKDN